MADMLGGRCPKEHRNVAKKGEPPLCKKLTAILRDKTKRKNERLAKKEARLAKVTRSKCPKGEHKTKTRGCVPHTTYMIAKLAKAAASRKKKSPITVKSPILETSPFGSPLYDPNNQSPSIDIPLFSPDLDDDDMVSRGDEEFDTKVGLKKYAVTDNGEVYDKDYKFYGKYINDKFYKRK